MCRMIFLSDKLLDLRNAYKQPGKFHHEDTKKTLLKIFVPACLSG